MKPASKYCHAAVVTPFRSEDCFWFPCGSCLLDRHWQGYAKIQLFSDCLITVLGFCNIGFWLSYSFSGTMLLVSGSYLVLCSWAYLFLKYLWNDVKGYVALPVTQLLKHTWLLLALSLWTLPVERGFGSRFQTPVCPGRGSCGFRGVSGACDTQKHRPVRFQLQSTHRAQA